MGMSKTYLYGYGDGPFGASKTRRTRAYIVDRPAFAVLEPEFLNRLFDLADAVIDAGSDFGFGGGGRTQASQYAMFKSRYDKRSTAASGWFWWDGRTVSPPIQDWGYWKKKSGVASAAPPGSSYHEASTKKGYALAADMVGDHKLANTICHTYGLKHFANVNSEPWHYQPIEIPNARREYKFTPEPLPDYWSPPVPLPPWYDEDMKDLCIMWRDKRYQNVFLVGPGGAVALTPEHFNRLVAAGIPLIVEQHEQNVQAYARQAGNVTLLPIK